MLHDLIASLVPVFIFALVGISAHYRTPAEDDIRFEDMSK